MTVYEVTEGQGSVEVCVVVFTPGGNCPIQYPFEVSLSFSEGSAGKFFHHFNNIVDLIIFSFVENDLDYSTQSTVVLQFDECDKRMCTSVIIVDDSVIENAENFTVTLHETPGTGDAITLTVVNGVINILDDDGELIFLVCVHWF